MRTADALTPFLTTRAATISLIVFCAVYAFIFAFGTFYIYRLMRAGPAASLGSFANRRGTQPADVACGSAAGSKRQSPGQWRIAMVLYWVAILAISILLYVLLDGFDLGIGILSIFARGEEAA